MNAVPDPLAACASFRAAGARAARAVAAGHPCVVLLGLPAETAALLPHATAPLDAAQATLHGVPAERFTPTDLVRPGHDGILVIADAERLSRASLIALDAHLRREPRAAPRARLLLAATPALREQTAFPDLATLHRAALLFDPPALAPAEQAALLEVIAPALGAPVREAIARLAEGDPAALLMLAGRSRLARIAATPWLARGLAHPLSLALASCALLAAALALALTHGPAAPVAPSSTMVAAPPAPQPPPPAPPVSPASVPPASVPPAPGSPDPVSPEAGASSPGAQMETSDPGAAPPDDGVMVDHENPEQAAAENAAHMPHLVAAQPGETLAAMYARVYRGMAAPPPLAAVEQVNPFPPVAGARLVFPAPRAGWPRF